MAAVFLRVGDVFDPESAIAQLRAWKGGIDKKAADTQAMSERLSALRVTRADANGLAEVTVDSTGNLVDLTFGRSASRVAPDVLARTVMTLIRDAAAQLADQTQEVIAETIGAESVAARAIAESVSRRLHQFDPHAAQES